MSAVTSTIALGAAAVGAAGSIMSANAQADAVKDAAEKEAEGLEKAQKLLEKRKNEAVSDLEAAELVAQGLITEEERVGIEVLNSTEKGAIETLKDWYKNTDTIYASAQELVLKDLVQYGIIQPRKDINDATQKIVSTVMGDSQKAMDLFEPYRQAGNRGLERQQFLTGTLTKEERQAHLDKYGEIEESPIYQFRQQQADRALSASQKKRGMIKSGAALKEELNLTNRLSAEEIQRQLNESNRLSNMGFGASQSQANALGNRMNTLANAYDNQGRSLANISQTGARNLASSRSDFSRLRGGLSDNTGTNLTNMKRGFGDIRRQIRTNKLANKRNLALQTARDKANINIGEGTQSANLMATAATNNANRMVQAAQAQNQGVLEGLSMINSGLGNFARQQGYNQGLQGANPNWGY